MGIFEQFPYTNFHELNLDWILKALKELEHTIDEFVAINALKYADPIQWNITSQYEKNTIVIDPVTGTAYISVQPVPSGVALTNTDYWTVVFDLGSFVTKLAKCFTDNWEESTTLTATFPTNAKDWLIWGDTLYMTMHNINAGDAYVEGSNIEKFTLEQYIGHLNNLTTWDTTDIVSAINSVKSDIVSTDNRIGDLADLTTWATDSIVNAINSVKTDVDNTTNNIIGDLNDLTTSDTSSVVNAINSVKTDVDNTNTVIGDLGDLTTWDTDSIVDAINSVKSDADTATNIVIQSSIYSFFHNKKILIIGDSNSIEGEAWRGRVWVDDFREILSSANVTIDNNSISGRTLSKHNATNNVVDVVDALSSNNDYDMIIVFCGVNDWDNQVPFGSMNTTSPYDFTKFDDSLLYVNETLMSKSPKAALYYITPLRVNYSNPTNPLIGYSAALKAVTNVRGRDINIIDGFCAPGYLVDGTNPTAYSMDGLHCNAAFAPILAKYIIESIISGGSPRSMESVTFNLAMNTNICTGTSFIKMNSDGTTEFYCQATITTGSYDALINDPIPAAMCTEYGANLWFGICQSSSKREIIPMDLAQYKPYTNVNYMATGDTYLMRQAFKPEAFNKTVY